MSHVDLDAILDGEQGLPFTFDFGGEKYSLPPRIDLKVLILMQQGEEQMFRAMEKLLGKEQWDRMIDSDTVLTEARLSALLDAYAKYQGLDSMGESSVSVPHSPSTGTPSKLTLPATTASTSGKRSAKAS